MFSMCQSRGFLCVLCFLYIAWGDDHHPGCSMQDFLEIYCKSILRLCSIITFLWEWTIILISWWKWKKDSICYSFQTALIFLLFPDRFPVLCSRSLVDEYRSWDILEGWMVPNIPLSHICFLFSLCMVSNGAKYSSISHMFPVFSLYG